MKDDKNTILRFIDHFKGSEDTFLHGCCYWFSVILYDRFCFFSDHAVQIWYEPVEGHFVTKIENHFYDVRGDVTELYRGKPMYNMHEMLRYDGKMYERLMRDCRDFREVGENA